MYAHKYGMCAPIPCTLCLEWGGKGPRKLQEERSAYFSVVTCTGTARPQASGERAQDQGHPDTSGNVDGG